VSWNWKGAHTGPGGPLDAAIGLPPPPRLVRAGIARRTGFVLALSNALQTEIEARRLFLWLPVAAGAGVALYFSADREPSLWFNAILTLAFALAAGRARAHLGLYVLSTALAAIFGGMVCAGWRTERLVSPILDRTRIATLEGYVEEVDLRRTGARFLLHLERAEGLGPRPYQVRLTMRKQPSFEAGAYVRLKARLLPPSHAALPGGYDFALDAFFARIGAVGSVLGEVREIVPPAERPDFFARLGAAIDRLRNSLARRIAARIGGEEAAIAVAMVTGKRDLLSEEARTLVREAGIFHIITISGIQMTLVAGLLFTGMRSLLALLPPLALAYPIRNWAAGFAMAGAVIYCMITGSRIGTERALFMTILMLGAVILGRPSITMRNLALAALCVILFEPEAVLGASFQLSFAAVAALIAVYEARLARRTAPAASAMWRPQRSSLILDPITVLSRIGTAMAHAAISTLAATGATASFMAYHFHELSPYVLIGNPLTLALIEFFAIPAALFGGMLFPLGFDGPIWTYLGLGISYVLVIARWIASTPGSTLSLGAFAPWSLVFLTLAVASMVIWRSWLLKATALPFALIGLVGTLSAGSADLIVSPGGEAVAIRGADGALGVIGNRSNSFAAEQWLRADGDGRPAADLTGAAKSKTARCDRLGCSGTLRNGANIAVIYDTAAFFEDCRRAAIIVTPEIAPAYCGAKLVIDRKILKAAGAIAVTLTKDGFLLRTARSPTEDRPWSPLDPTAAQNWPRPRRDDAATDPSRLETGSKDLPADDPGRAGSAGEEEPEND
jgi:competence protein ComEC